MTQEEENKGICTQHFNTNRGQSSATQPNFWLDSWPPVPEHPPDRLVSSEEPKIEKVVLKTRVPFKRKKLDLSIYTFDKTPIE